MPNFTSEINQIFFSFLILWNILFYEILISLSQNLQYNLQHTGLCCVLLMTWVGNLKEWQIFCLFYLLLCWTIHTGTWWLGLHTFWQRFLVCFTCFIEIVSVDIWFYDGSAGFSLTWCGSKWPDFHYICNFILLLNFSFIVTI